MSSNSNSGGVETPPEIITPKYPLWPGIIDHIGYWENWIKNIELHLPNGDRFLLVKETWNDVGFKAEPGNLRFSRPGSYVKLVLNRTISDPNWVLDNYNEWTIRRVNDNSIIVQMLQENGGREILDAIAKDNS